MSVDSVSLPLAFAAGLASFLSPCVLPLLPAYLAYLGRPRGDTEAAGRWATAANAAAFALGLTLVFVLVFYAVAGLVAPVHHYVAPVAGAAVVLLSLHLAGVVKIPLLDREWLPVRGAPRARGVFGGFMLGAGFAAGWTPCIGITLGAVLGSAASQGHSAKGLALMLAYACGLGLPFVGLGLSAGRALARLRPVRPLRRALDLASAGVLLAMGVLLLSDNLAALAGLAARLAPTQLADPFGL